ncbi:LysE/ArgO family amino acid transporter [Legionella fairfieldensis]|uniref:LysE/ArgO family amino acid transporter n=1 Tax=Legionella fairfieldensis TaxID=45064 RepID=UPI00048DB7B3|nr:LysE family transporter [Legionella fairfieldensis]
MSVYFNGLLLGLSLIMALGPQNIFLIRQGTKRNHPLLSVVICFCCDVILVWASVAGLHEALKLHPALQTGMTWSGAAFLFYYGLKALKQALNQQTSQTTYEKQRGRLQIVLLALSFSLLNPQAIIDSLIIIGSGSSQFPDHPLAFLFGVISSSLLWFTSLTFTTHYFAEVLARATIWRRIELVSGLLMLFLSLKLVYN